MKWVKEWNCFIKCNKFANEFCKSSKWYHMVDKVQNAADNSSKILNPSGMLQRSSMGGRRMIFWQGQMLVSVAPRGFEVNSDIGNCRNRMHISVVRGFTQSSGNEPHLTRDWMAKLWLEEKKTRKPRRAKKSKAVQRGQSQGSWFDAFSSFKLPATRWFKDGRLAEQRFDNSEKSFIKQPPRSQSATRFLKPTSAEEATIAPLLARDNLLITRDIEWANLMLGFEQENRYAIVDPCYPQSPVGFMREQSNVIFRQLLRSRRPFIAYITDAMGNELFRVRRPIWFINSTIYAEVDGKEIGVVHRRWHLWRRVYDLYLGNKQFAVVENPGFWNWTFTLKDSDGNVLAEIDRDWRGIGFELFTDAGQYAIRFGNLAPRPTTGPAREIQQLNISRSLTLSERATALALAVSLDNDYFSRHGGWGLPFFAVEE